MSYSISSSKSICGLVAEDNMNEDDFSLDLIFHSLGENNYHTIDLRCIEKQNVSVKWALD